MKLVRIICTALIAALLFTSVSFAGEAGAQELQQSADAALEVFSDETAGVKTIISIEALPAETARQTITIGSGKSPLLPATLTVHFQGETESTPLAVTWACQSQFDNAKAGTYTYEAVLSQGYQLDTEVSLPQIQVLVIKGPTSLSGFPKSLKKKSRQTLSQKVTISPAYGRTALLQMYQRGKWVTKKTYTLSQSGSDTFTITFPSDWWKVTSSQWRIHIPESEQAAALTSSNLTVKTQRYYQNPSKYIQIQDKITLRHSGAYKLKTGYMGLKVQKVNRYFKIGNKYWPRYTAQTKRKVKAFQRRKKLKATGVVDKATWLKMGFSESSWYNLGAYVSPIKVNPSSTKKDHVEAMISTAKKYKGSNYVVGASGSPKQGADCSGLIMQAMYAAGADPYPVSSVRHSKPGYEYESRNLWKSKKLKTIPYTKKKRGDLIFYKGRGGAVIHVAIYLGNGKVIESWPNKVVIWPVKNSRRSSIKGVKRVFN